MDHKKSYSSLGRKSAHRISMLNNMSTSLIENGRIKTTLAKAKALRPYFESRIITVAKNNTNVIANRRLKHMIRNDVALKKLLSEFVNKYKERNGGYLRIIKSGIRYGDKADMAIVEMV